MFKYLVPLLRTPENLERVAFELAADSAADGIRYLEVRYAPALTVHRGLTAEDSVAAVLRGLEAAGRRFGVESRLILCLLRGQSQRECRATLKAARRFAGRGVAGLDLAGTESARSADYAPYFEEGRSLGLGATCHAGETRDPEHLRAALGFGVSRIGHGTLLARRPELLREVRNRGICIEVSLSSNLATGAVPSVEMHPFLEFHRTGVAVCLNTDDREVFGIDLSHEYALALQAGAGFEELTAMALSGARHAFLPAEKKRALRARMSREIAALRRSLKAPVPA